MAHMPPNVITTKGNSTTIMVNAYTAYEEKLLCKRWVFKPNDEACELGILFPC